MSKITPRTPLGAEHPLKLAQRDDRPYINVFSHRARGRSDARQPDRAAGHPMKAVNVRSYLLVAALYF
jgi:hypothetical protein